MTLQIPVQKLWWLNKGQKPLKMTCATDTPDEALLTWYQQVFDTTASRWHPLSQFLGLSHVIKHWRCCSFLSSSWVLASSQETLNSTTNSSQQVDWCSRGSKACKHGILWKWSLDTCRQNSNQSTTSQLFWASLKKRHNTSDCWRWQENKPTSSYFRS